MARKSGDKDSLGKLMGAGDSSRRRRAPATPGGRGPSGPSGPMMNGPSGPSGPSGPMMRGRARKRRGPEGGSDELMRRLYG